MVTDGYFLSRCQNKGTIDLCDLREYCEATSFTAKPQHTLPTTNLHRASRINTKYYTIQQKVHQSHGYPSGRTSAKVLRDTMRKPVASNMKSRMVWWTRG